MDELIEKQYILNMRGIYSETAIDHARNPRNVGNIVKPDGFGQESGDCGDTMAIWLAIKKDRIAKATFWTDGCGATIACGSMITELVKDKTIKLALEVDGNMVVEALDGLPDDHTHCAFLSAEALRKALLNYIELSRYPWKKVYL